MRKIIIFILIFFYGIAGLNALNLKDYIFVVEPKIHSKTKETFYAVADKFKEKKMDQLSDIFRSFADGGHGTGFLIKDKDGTYYIVTNRHVVNHAETVNIIKQNDDGTTVKYENCQIVYIDNEIDIAFLSLPPQIKDAANAFPLAEGEPTDGDEVWSAGFPGLLGKPGWQFAKGNVTNRRAFINELLDIKISYVVQHSAPIDPGNSGGPLLVTNKSAKLGYNVIGINTWQIGSRQNTNFAIPANLIMRILPKVKEAEKMKKNSIAMKDELVRTCTILSSELASENPDWNEVRQFVSYSFVGEKGWDSFLYVLKNSDKKNSELWENSFFNVSPIETMRSALYIAFWNTLHQGKEKPAVVFVDINVSDADKFGKGEAIRTNFKINEKDVELLWVLEFGHWRISYANLDTVLGDVKTTASSEKKGTGLYPFSFWGIQMFMGDLKLDNKDLYDKIMPDYAKLETKQTTASIVTWGGGVLGGIVMIIGFVMFQEDMRNFNFETGPGMGLMIGGGALGTLCLSIGPFLGPNEQDIMQFINTHNRFSDTPLNLQK